MLIQNLSSRNMREFTGAAFIEFQTEEEAQRCATMPIKVGGVNLEVSDKLTHTKTADRLEIV